MHFEDDPKSWMGPMGECRACGGEIPYGHVSPCFVHELQKKNDDLHARLRALVERWRERGHEHDMHDEYGAGGAASLCASELEEELQR